VRLWCAIEGVPLIFGDSGDGGDRTFVTQRVRARFSKNLCLREMKDNVRLTRNEQVSGSSPLVGSLYSA
jgi:hypothetical protein